MGNLIPSTSIVGICYRILTENTQIVFDFYNEERKKADNDKTIFLISKKGLPLLLKTVQKKINKYGKQQISLKKALSMPEYERFLSTPQGRKMLTCVSSAFFGCIGILISMAFAQNENEIDIYSALREALRDHEIEVLLSKIKAIDIYTRTEYLLGNNQHQLNEHYKKEILEITVRLEDICMENPNSINPLFVGYYCNAIIMHLGIIHEISIKKKNMHLTYNALHQRYINQLKNIKKNLEKNINIERHSETFCFEGPRVDRCRTYTCFKLRDNNINKVISLPKKHEYQRCKTIERIARNYVVNELANINTTLNILQSKEFFAFGN